MQQDILQAAMQITLEQEYLSWSLPKNCHVILSSNPAEGDVETYNVTSIDAAQSTRYLTVKMKADSKQWARWAENNAIPSACINFILHHAEVIDDYAKFRTSPRAMSLFFQSLWEFRNSLDKELFYIRAMGENATSDSFINIFLSYLIEESEIANLMTPEQILTEPIGSVETFLRKYSSNQPILAMLAFRLESYVLSKKDTLDAAQSERFAKLLIDSYNTADGGKTKPLFTKDLCTALVIQNVNTNDVIKKYILKNGKALADILLGS